MFHVRRRPADVQPRRRKKKVGAGAGAAGGRPSNEPLLLEMAPDATPLENGRRLRITDVVEVGSGNGTSLQLYGPSIQPRHCVVAPAEGGGYAVTPLHADAHVYVNGRRIMHTQRLQHGCLLKFGRVSTFRFVDPAQENLINRNLAQSQHFGSGSIYDRSPTSPGENSGAMSPTSMSSHQQDPLDSNANTTNDTEYQRTMSPVSQDTYYRDANDTIPPYNNNNTLKLDNESLIMSQHLNDSKDDYVKDEHSSSVYNDQDQSGGVNRTVNSQYKDNYETTFDLDGNVETKSICSAKSGGSGHDNRMSGMVVGNRQLQEAILPAVLEFPEAGQAQFLAAVITRLDPHAPAFKLAPVYTLYLCARYRASTHYRPELTPTERAHKLTAFLHHVATLIHATVQERCTDSAAQAFWMTNASELLHFLKYDRHISSFSTQAQDLLSITVQNAFSNLVSCFQEELSRGLATLTSQAVSDATEATAPTLQALAAAIVLLRRCRVNAALTIQLFSHLFHYINAVCFNKLVTEPSTVSARWGAALSARLKVLAAWAERQGLELAAECHFARMNQAARLIQGEYRSEDEVCAALKACFKLNSVQARALLSPLAPPDVVEAGVAYVRTHTDELYRADGREIRLEEGSWLGAGLLIPSDGFSAEVVCGVPPGLAEFVAPLQRGGLCRLAHQTSAPGAWTVYMGAAPTRRAIDPRTAIIQLHKNSNGMGLSIVAAKGAGQTKLGIYIKSVVPGGAAAADGRLAAGDQLLSVDGQSLVGITQEKAAEYLVRTGPTVTLEVAKQGAMLHGLATLLHQPAYNQRQDEEVQYEDRVRRNSGTFTNMHPALLKPTSPLTELATAGYGRRPFHNRCQILRDESTESSTDESEEWQPQYHGSIPRLIVTLDRENNQLLDDLSPDTPGCPLELKCDRAPPRPIPVFTFTCEDFDELHPTSDDVSECVSQTDESQQQEPPPVPEPPVYYDQSSDNGEPICLPPQMRPIDTRLTLDLFNARSREQEYYRRRCTGVDECVSACECCRTPQPEAQQIPYIDEPNSEPLIFENEGPPEVATPKIRRILPSLSLDQSDSDRKPETVDAVCQTPSSPLYGDEKEIMVTPNSKKLELNLDIKNDEKVDNIQCRLKRALFSMSTSFSGKSEDTEFPSTYSTSDSFEQPTHEKFDVEDIKVQTPADPGAKQILDSVDRKSWKSPDEYRPAFGKVKALTKHFNNINLKYCVKSYKRNCQSSPNLSIRGRDDKNTKALDNLPVSTSLADIQYECNKTETSDTKGEKMSDDEVKSILIQLEDWSRYGSRGSEDTLAHGNEFEVPNLPSEEHTDNALNSYVFNEIVDKKPRRITLDNIKLKSNQSSVNSDQAKSKESLVKSESLEKISYDHLPRVVAMIPSMSSLLNVSRASTSRLEGFACSCPDISNEGDVPTTSGGNAVRRASERDLPSRLAAEPVKSSKSTPALHHVASPPTLHHHNTPTSPAVSTSVVSGSPSAWPSKSRSSHNLSAPSQHDGFYQNLSTVQSQQHALQDRWSSLRSSTGSNRPQSAHFAAGAQSEPPDSPLHHQQSNAMSARAAKLAEMSEEVSRRQQAYQMHHKQAGVNQLPPNAHPHQHIMGQPPLHLHQGQPLHYQPQSPQLPPNMQVATGPMLQTAQGPMLQTAQGPMLQHATPPMHMHPAQAQPQQIYHNQHVPPQRYEWLPPGPPSPQRSQPPVAPKPQGARRTDMETDEQSYPQPQLPSASSIQPEDERYVASALEPPAMSVYPTGGAGAGAGRGAPPHNPWQREERERQAEARRAAARARRDAAIAQLVSLGASRTPVQNQQLRSLQLERDFELRATQHDQEESNTVEGAEDIEETVDDSAQSVVSAASPPPPSPAPTAQAPPHPPKSILKTNTRTEITNGYTTETQVITSESRMSEVSGHLSGLALSSAPAPPARGSSFAVMAERARTLSPARTHHETAHTHHGPAPMSPVSTLRDKRVSFHERAAPPAPPSCSPPPLHDPPPPQREDPDRFIEEAESMLAGPASPPTPTNAPAGLTHTPGVIGAQEVYRDPRARRLAEQQARASTAPIPEQLSFKEKMKMFALESGEASTPKDKVKISRAQRDIDAVH